MSNGNWDRVAFKKTQKILRERNPSNLFIRLLKTFFGGKLELSRNRECCIEEKEGIDTIQKGIKRKNHELIVPYQTYLIRK